MSISAVSAGAVFDVAVDIRRGSPSFGRWVGVIKSAKSGVTGASGARKRRCDHGWVAAKGPRRICVGSYGVSGGVRV